ncbi:hypothetical protein [Natronorubrum sp. DTA28]|uniref:hypothetical protein n=1 Tax=Natronorubrum sp. DTA28 TaxID=3447019 RepID=UPI003F84AC19
MAIRTNEKSNSRLGRLRDRIRSTLFAGRDASGEDAVDKSAAEQRPTNPDAPGNLFHCSTCGNVYIDSEKSSCTACEEDVEQVSSTLDSSPVRH